MRLLYLLSDRGIPLASGRGSAVHVRSLLEALAELGHHVGVMARSFAGSEPLSPRMETIQVSAGHAERIARRRAGDLLEGLGIDSPLPGEIETLLHNQELAEKAIPVLEAWRPDVVIERLSLFGTAGLAMARSINVPLLLEVNAPLVEETRRWRRIELGDLADRIERRLLKETDAVLAVSPALRAWAVGQGTPTGRAHLVENGVDADLFVPEGQAAPVRRMWGIGEKAFLIGFAGSLKPWHGVEILLESVASLCRQGDDIHLLVVGTGPLVGSLREQASQLGVDGRVHLAGEVPHAEVPGLLRACDALAAPYPALPEFYFSPLKVLEYLALGRPVVASAIGPIPGWIRDGEDGLLVPPGDAGALAGALARICQDGPLARRLAASAPSRIAGRSWRDVASRVAEIAEICRLHPAVSHPAAAGERP